MLDAVGERLDNVQKEKSRLTEFLEQQQTQNVQQAQQISHLQDEVRFKDLIMHEQAAKFEAQIGRLQDEVRLKDLIQQQLDQERTLSGDLAARLRSSEEATLLEFFYQRLEKLDPDAPDIIHHIEELASIHKTLQQLRPPKIVWESQGVGTPRVSIVVPLFSNQELACRLLSSLDKSTSFRDFEVIVVNDNPSEPLVPEIRSPEYGFPMKVLQNSWNMGYPAATNVGCEHARGRMLLLLNSDILPKREDWLDRMVETMEHDPQTAIVGAKTLYHETNIIEHFGMFALYDSVMDCFHNKHYFDGVEDGLFSETQTDQEVDMVTGAAMMIRSPVFRELNGFNIRFLIGGFEDSDICRRVHELGFHVRVSAGAVLDHHKSVSLRKSPHFKDSVFACNRRTYHHFWRETLEEQNKKHALVPRLHRMDSKIRVLFVAHGFPPEQIGGTEVYNKNLAEAFAELGGFEPVILTAAPVKGPESHDGLIARNRQAVSKVPVFSCFRSVPNFTNEHALAEHEFERLLCSVRPDVIHFNHVERLSANFLKIAKRATSAFILYTLQEFLPICPANGHLVYKDGSICSGPETKKCADCVNWDAGEVESRAALYRDNFSFVDLFIAPSHQIRERYVQWGLSPDRVFFSNYGLPLPTHKKEKRQGPKVKFSYIGQIIPHKGVSLLLDALNILSGQADGKYEMHFHGWTPEREWDFLKRFEIRIKKMRNVFFHGPYDGSQVYELIADADAVVVPSLWPENSPITIQEAFAMNVPVITADVGGMKELMTEGEYGLMFRWKDAADLAAKLQQAVEQPEMLSKFSANLESRHIKSIEENARELAEIYTSQASRNRLIEGRELEGEEHAKK